MVWKKVWFLCENLNLGSYQHQCVSILTCFHTFPFTMVIKCIWWLWIWLIQVTLLQILLGYWWHSISSWTHFLITTSLSVQFLFLVWFSLKISLNLVWFLTKTESEFSLILCILSLISIVGGLLKVYSVPIQSINQSIYL